MRVRKAVSLSLSVQQMVKAQVLAFDGPVLITEKENKSVKSVSVQQVGNKKDHLIRFDVSRV